MRKMESISDLSMLRVWKARNTFDMNKYGILYTICMSRASNCATKKERDSFDHNEFRLRSENCDRLGARDVFSDTNKNPIKPAN